MALVRGDLDAALESLEKSQALDSNSADTRYLLVNLLLEGLQTDFAKFEGLAQKYASVVEFGPQQFRFLQQLTLGKIRSGQPLAAFEQLLKLVPKVGSTFAATQNRQRELELASGYVVDSDAWIATELSRTYVQASPAERQQMEQLVADELASIENMLIPLQREKLRFLQWLPSAAPRLIELASSMMGGDEHTIADQILLPLLHADDPQLPESALRLLSQPTSSDNNQIRYGSLEMNSVIDGQPAADLTAEGLQSSGWREGLVRVDISDRSRYAYGKPVDLVSQRYGRPELTVAMSGSMVMLRTGNGTDRGRLDFPGASADAATDELTRATLRGGLLLIEKSSEVAAFDIQRDLMSGGDALLWRHSLFSPGTVPQIQFAPQDVVSENTQLGFAISHRKMPSKQQSVVGPLTPAGVLLQIGTKLMMLDALTGRQVWMRDGYDDSVSLAAQDLEIAVVHRSQGRVQILDCRDGKALRQSEVAGKWLHWFSHNGLLVDLSRSDVIPPPPPTVRVWNAFTGAEVMRVEAAIGSCADVCEGRYLVVLEPNSKLHYCDLDSPGQTLVVQHVIESDARVNSISVERFQDRLVVLSTTEKAAPGREEIQQVNGDVFGLETTSGKLLWSSPGQLSGVDVSNITTSWVMTLHAGAFDLSSAGRAVPRQHCLN